jgi:hypothetical protein
MMDVTIIVQSKDVLIGKVLVNNGSILNILPRNMLKEISIDESHMRPSTRIARVYDGSPRQIIRTLEVKFYMGPQMFLVTL